MSKAKRILALITVIFLILLNIVTIILSFLKGELAQKMFMASLFATVTLPVILYVFFAITKVISDKKNNNQDNA